jgi:hypothetical protein
LGVADGAQIIVHPTASKPGTPDSAILKVDGTKVADTGKRFKLPGHPASMRIGSQ